MHTEYSSSEVLCRLSTHKAGLREKETKYYSPYIYIYIYIYIYKCMHNKSQHLYASTYPKAPLVRCSSTQLGEDTVTAV